MPIIEGRGNFSPCSTLESGFLFSSVQRNASQFLGTALDGSTFPHPPAPSKVSYTYSSQAMTKLVTC